MTLTEGDAGSKDLINHRLGRPGFHCVRCAVASLLRPELTKTEPALVVMIERVGAFGVLGILFLVSYAERPRLVCLVVFGSAIALEFAQIFVPDRHARLVDALEKIVGGGAGILLGVALLPALTSAGGTFSKIGQRLLRSGQKTLDSESRELLVGFFIFALFALALVIFQDLGRELAMKIIRQ